MGIARFCLPIIRNTCTEILETVKDNDQRFGFFEAWLDYVEDLEEDLITRLASQLQGRIIFVFRRKQLEPIKMPLQRRLSLLSSIHRTKAYVDLDISTQPTEIDHISANNLQINTIFSYHDYEKTPTDHELRNIIDRMRGDKATICKVATMCNSERDALRLLTLRLNLNQDTVRAIVLGMGEHGLITRIFATLWGNEMCFTPLTLVERSAEGQLTRDEFEKILKLIKG